MPHDSSPPDPLAIAHETIVSAGNILAAAGFSRMEIAAIFRQAADQLAPTAPPAAGAREAGPAPQPAPADAILAEFAGIAPLRTMRNLIDQAGPATLRDRFDLAMQVIPQIAEAQAWLRTAAREAGLAIEPREDRPGGPPALPLDAFHEACGPGFALIGAIAEVLAAERDEAALQLILMSLVDNEIAVSRDLKEAMERAVTRLSATP